MRIAKDHFDNWHSTKATIQTLLNRKITAMGAPQHWIDADFLMTGGAGKNRRHRVKRRAKLILPKHFFLFFFHQVVMILSLASGVLDKRLSSIALSLLCLALCLRR